MKYQRWNLGTPSQADVEQLQEAGYAPLLSTLLSGRGIATVEQAAELLDREEYLVHAPSLMQDMDKAVERIQKAIAQGETMAVFGDYDVDGITSTCLLCDYLRSTGASCLRHIPRRDEEGYGLGCDSIQMLYNQGATLLITVDCGITGFEEVAFANTLGMDVIITDHHACQATVPQAVAVVNPHRHDCQYPFKHLAGVGVALKLVLALGGESREEALFTRYCTLAAIGTVADVMRMEGENRTIVRRGLEMLPHTDFVGIHALLKEAGLQGKEVTSVQIGFVLSPRINAAGRMGAADLAADLLESKDPAQAERLAVELCQMNRQRQEVEQDICADADARIQEMDPEQRYALVLGSDQWHQGVVGIVASRLSEKYAAPSFMMHIKDGVGKGSCRSYGGFNLYEALEHCADLLEGFGGHELAAGFTILEKNIPQLRTRLNRYVRSATKGQPCVTFLDVDAVIANPSMLTLEELDQLSQLEPYGAGNPRPVFALLGAMVDGVQLVGQGKHLKLRLSKGLHRFDGIFFSVTPEDGAVQVGQRVDVAFHLQANTFRGNTTLQMQLVDLRYSRCPSRQEAESLALVERVKEGQPISSQERAKLQITRQQFATLWKAIEPLLRYGKQEEPLLPLLRRLGATLHGAEGFLRAAMALEVFADRKLLQMNQHGEYLTLSLIPVEGKVDLFASPYLASLQEGTGAGK